MTHTPTPWQVKHDWDEEGATTIVANVDGDTSADGTTYYTYDTISRCSDRFEEFLPNAAANAAHIVHCVNTHDALVKALEDVRAIANDRISDAHKVERILERMALAKGEGE